MSTISVWHLWKYAKKYAFQLTALAVPSSSCSSCSTSSTSSSSPGDQSTETVITADEISMNDFRNHSWAASFKKHFDCQDKQYQLKASLGLMAWHATYWIMNKTPSLMIQNLTAGVKLFYRLPPYLQQPPLLNRTARKSHKGKKIQIKSTSVSTTSTFTLLFMFNIRNK